MILLVAALAAVQPVSAPPAPPPVTAPAPMDPARLAMAEKVVAALVPDGVYARMMRDQMPKMIDAMMAQMGAMTPRDMGVPAGKGVDPTQSLDQAMASADPAYRERSSIIMRVMFEEMGTVFGRMEPRLRAGLSRAFAAKFTAAQLNDMNTFFVSPSGRAFANDYLTMFVDPEVMREMTTMMPELVKAMPDIMKKAEAATAHLPPPPKRAKSGD